MDLIELPKLVVWLMGIGSAVAIGISLSALLRLGPAAAGIITAVAFPIIWWAVLP